MALYVVHDSEEKIRCAFNTLVIKNEALAKHYRGGLKGFLQKNLARCNNHITVLCYMGGEIDETIAELMGNGLIGGKDFAFVDAGSIAIYYGIGDKTARQKNVDVGISWLKARYAYGEIYVWYSEGR